MIPRSRAKLRGREIIGGAGRGESLGNLSISSLSRGGETRLLGNSVVAADIAPRHAIGEPPSTTLGADSALRERALRASLEPPINSANELKRVRARNRGRNRRDTTGKSRVSVVFSSDIPRFNPLTSRGGAGEGRRVAAIWSRDMRAACRVSSRSTVPLSLSLSLPLC